MAVGMWVFDRGRSDLFQRKQPRHIGVNGRNLAQNRPADAIQSRPDLGVLRIDRKRLLQERNSFGGTVERGGGEAGEKVRLRVPRLPGQYLPSESERRCW